MAWPIREKGNTKSDAIPLFVVSFSLTNSLSGIGEVMGEYDKVVKMRRKSLDVL